MSHRPVNHVSPDHPRWSVLDSASAKYLLVDIGLERKADMDGNVHNGGFGDWDGMIFHFRTRFDKEPITLLRYTGWTHEQVIQTMDSYIATFQTLNTRDSLESYDFDEAIVDEIIAWPPVPSGQIPHEEMRKLMKTTAGAAIANRHPLSDSSGHEDERLPRRGGAGGVHPRRAAPVGDGGCEPLIINMQWSD